MQNQTNPSHEEGVPELKLAFDLMSVLLEAIQQSHLVAQDLAECLEQRKHLEKHFMQGIRVYGTKVKVSERLSFEMLPDVSLSSLAMQCKAVCSRAWTDFEDPAPPRSADYHMASFSKGVWHNDVPLLLKSSGYRPATLREVLCALLALAWSPHQYPVVTVFGSPRLGNEEERPYIGTVSTPLTVETTIRSFWLDPETDHVLVTNLGTATY